MPSSFRDKIIKGGVVTVSGQTIASGINFLKGILLARILTPEDFGLIAAIMAITNVTFIIKDFGLSTVIIQKKKITKEEINSIFWFNVFMGFVFTILFLLISKWIGYFYNNEELIILTQGFSFVFILSSLYPTQLALFRRELEFGKPVKISIFGQVTSIIVAITLAMNGLGVWSLIWMSLSNHFSMAILSFILSSWKPSKTNLKKLLESTHNIKMGINILGFNVVNYLARNTDKILIGKMFSPFNLGLYSKSSELSLFAVNQIRGPIDGVALPALRQLIGNKEKYRKYYKSYLVILTFIIWSSLLYIILFSEEIVSLVLGEKWIKMVFIFKILSVNALFQAIAGTRGTIMLSFEKNRRYFYWGLFNSIFTVIGFSISVLFSIEMVAIVYTFYNIIILIPSLIYCYKDTYIEWFDFFKFTMPIQSFLLGNFVICFILKYFMNNTLINLGIISLCYWFCILFVAHRTKVLKDLFNAIKQKI